MLPRSSQWCGVWVLTSLKENRILLAKISSSKPCQVKILATIAWKTGDSIILRDVTGFREFKIKGSATREILRLPCETSIYVEGLVEGDYLEVNKYEVVYPSKLECCETDAEDVREYAFNYHMYVGRPRYFEVIRTISILSYLIRNALISEGFTELQPPILGWKSDPGLRGASTARGFYYIENAEKPGYNVDWNLIVPEGHGEVLDGGCREYRVEELEKRIKSTGENPSEYQWFLDIVSKGYVKPTCGWGLGLERLVKAFHGLAHVGFATPHPRLPGVIGP